MPEAFRLLPDLIRVIRRMAADNTAPRSVKIKLALLLVYLLSPVDLVPDFIPMIGQADDVIIVALAQVFHNGSAGHRNPLPSGSRWPSALLPTPKSAGTTSAGCQAPPTWVEMTFRN